VIYFEQKSKLKVFWRILSYICAGVALFLIINFSVLASYVKTQRSSEQEQIRTEQKIGKQLVDRKIAKLEKEKQEAELQRQTKGRVRAEKEAEEAQRKAEETEAEVLVEILRENKKQTEAMKRQQQVLAAQEAERQVEALREQQILDQRNKEKSCLQEAHIFADMAYGKKFEEVSSQKLGEYNRYNNDTEELGQTFSEQIQSTFDIIKMSLEFADLEADTAAQNEYDKVYWEQLEKCQNR